MKMMLIRRHHDNFSFPPNKEEKTYFTIIVNEHRLQFQIGAGKIVRMSHQSIVIQHMRWHHQNDDSAEH